MVVKLAYWQYSGSFAALSPAFEQTRIFSWTFFPLPIKLFCSRPRFLSAQIFSELPHYIHS